MDAMTTALARGRVIPDSGAGGSPRPPWFGGQGTPRVSVSQGWVRWWSSSGGRRDGRCTHSTAYSSASPGPEAVGAPRGAAPGFAHTPPPPYDRGRPAGSGVGQEAGDAQAVSVGDRPCAPGCGHCLRGSASRRPARASGSPTRSPPRPRRRHGAGSARCCTQRRGADDGIGVHGLREERGDWPRGRSWRAASGGRAVSAAFARRPTRGRHPTPTTLQAQLGRAQALTHGASGGGLVADVVGGCVTTRSRSCLAAGERRPPQVTSSGRLLEPHTRPRRLRPVLGVTVAAAIALRLLGCLLPHGLRERRAEAAVFAGLAPRWSCSPRRGAVVVCAGLAGATLGLAQPCPVRVAALFDRTVAENGSAARRRHPAAHGFDRHELIRARRTEGRPRSNAEWGSCGGRMSERWRSRQRARAASVLGSAVESVRVQMLDRQTGFAVGDEVDRDLAERRRHLEPVPGERP
jgi:hypothetical protein